jgi:hypothetical protein
MTTLPPIGPDVDYALVDPSPTAPLSGTADDPAHASLHSDVNYAIRSLDDRLMRVEQNVTQLVKPKGSVEQARRAAHEWTVRGPLVKDDKLLLPILWNMTGQAVTYEAAKATVYTPAASSNILIDIVNGTDLINDSYDPNTQTSIFKAGGLYIEAGQTTSVTVLSTDVGASAGFVADMPNGSYLAAVIRQVGSVAQPGANLTIQLNRLL